MTVAGAGPMSIGRSASDKETDFLGSRANREECAPIAHALQNPRDDRELVQQRSVRGNDKKGGMTKTASRTDEEWFGKDTHNAE